MCCVQKPIDAIGLICCNFTGIMLGKTSNYLTDDQFLFGILAITKVSGRLWTLDKKIKSAELNSAMFPTKNDVMSLRACVWGSVLLLL